MHEPAVTPAPRGRGPLDRAVTTREARRARARRRPDSHEEVAVRPGDDRGRPQGVGVDDALRWLGGHGVPGDGRGHRVLQGADQGEIGGRYGQGQVDSLVRGRRRR